MLYKTKLGEFDLSDEEVITFPNGIPGFEDLKKYAVISLEETLPIFWLVSLDDDTVALPLIDPWMILDDYEVQLSQEDIDILEIEDPSEITIWTVLTIPVGRPQETTANLKAPIVINLRSGLGCQAILEGYEIKHSLKDPSEESESEKVGTTESNESVKTDRRYRPTPDKSGDR
ncbi:MAG TPA: flagellar assembly protein FliW [Fervidobacterium sp.]|nr:flagellar assembly protein FliW [Fervidobacterium sp.]HOK87696.1 flagellar assembly protein FliW [Fervidobacterium sp.]HOM74003.1 flagellar assembly protein FliW [Fervidobacterium sp.]HOQ39351.1 flagellar assembly protein FliW [Fervidobacterium sp.]HPP17663.1 flagellar assembly protein FliW [Fervidobacterium sp.]